MDFLEIIAQEILAETGEKPKVSIDNWMGTQYHCWRWGSGPTALELTCYAGIPSDTIWLWSAHHNLETHAAADVPLHEICEGDEFLFTEALQEALRLMKEAIALKAVALLAQGAE